MKLRRLCSQILIFFYVSSFIFKENHTLVEKDNPSEKIVITEEKLDGIDTDDTGNLEDLLRLVLINGKCWNPKVVVASGEFSRNINKRRS